MTAKIFHIILSLSVLLSTTGIRLGKHFCKNEMQAVEVLAKTKACCKGKATCGSESGGCDKDCCSHEYEYFQSDQNKLVQSVDLPTLNKSALMATLSLVFAIEVPSTDNNTLHFQTYRPPIVQQDIPVLLQTFLIWLVENTSPKRRRISVPLWFWKNLFTHNMQSYLACIAWTNSFRMTRNPATILLDHFSTNHQ